MRWQAGKQDSDSNVLAQRSCKRRQRTSEEPCGDCAYEKIMQEGVCRKEFLAFDTCYEAAQARNEDEQACMRLWDKFRECMKNRATLDHVVKEAMGG